jgi:hypothetical protein
MQRCQYACHTAPHALSRRGFLGSTAALGLGGFASPAAAGELQKAQKRVLVIFLSGGVSQLETWDPKPNTDTGGPFKAIQTSVTGTRISELLPHTAKQAHKLAIVRSLNSISDDHGIGEKIMLTGRRMEPGIEYPHIGAVSAKLLGGKESALPGNIQILPKGGSSATTSRRPTCSAPKTSAPTPTPRARPSARSSTTGSRSRASRPQPRRTPRVTSRPSGW